MTNPYQAPTDLDAPSPTVIQTSTLGIDFQSDWSASGLRRRRQRWWHRLIDVAFATLTILWLGSLLMTTGGLYAGSFCVLTPCWFVIGFVWIANMGFRNGESFHRKYPGFSGVVHGQVDHRSVVIHGPRVSLATKSRNCLQCRVSESFATLQPPGFETSLPILGPDIIRTRPANMNAPGATTKELLNELSATPPRIQIEAVIRGSDLKSLSCWRFWKLTGACLVGLGMVALLGSILHLLLPQFNTLAQKPNNQIGDTDGAQTAGTILIGIIGLGLIITGVWQWSRTWRRIGPFFVGIDEQQIAIASNLAAYAYRHEALGHFRWSRTGLIVRDAGRRILFAIPAICFNEEEQRLMESWFGRPSQPPSRSHYLGPKW